jgi:hypothetical protein
MNDAFISYAHNDNLPLGGASGPQWVSSLHEDLETCLIGESGEKLKAQYVFQGAAKNRASREGSRALPRQRVL